VRLAAPRRVGRPPRRRHGRPSAAAHPCRDDLRMRHTTQSPAFARFVAAAERHIDDPPAIADHLAVLLGADGWLSARDQRPGADRYRQHLLYVSPTRRLSVVALVWQPGQRTPIHDHIAWCVVGDRGRRREDDLDPRLTAPTSSGAARASTGASTGCASSTRRSDPRVWLSASTVDVLGERVDCDGEGAESLVKRGRRAAVEQWPRASRAAADS
jgi:hypothetical protein